MCCRLKLDFPAGLGQKNLAANKNQPLGKKVFFGEIFVKIFHEVSVCAGDSRLDLSAGLGQKNLAAIKSASW